MKLNDVDTKALKEHFGVWNREEFESIKDEIIEALTLAEEAFRRPPNADAYNDKGLCQFLDQHLKPDTVAIALGTFYNPLFYSISPYSQEEIYDYSLLIE